MVLIYKYLHSRCLWTVTKEIKQLGYTNRA